MNTNIGKTERIIRFVVAVVVIALGYFVLAGWMQTVAYVLGAVLLLTAAFGFCPAYALCKKFKPAKTAAKPAKKASKKKK